MRWLRERLAGDSEAGLTLIEMLVAAAMSVVLVGAASSMMISAVRTQPELSKRAQDVSTARWILERMTREIRNGIAVEPSSNGSVVSFRAYVRHSTCGGAGALGAAASASECQITYDCSSGASCTRTETDPGLTGGTPKPIFTGLSSDKVFNYSPPSASEATFVGVTLRFPNPGGSGTLTVSDGASLRTADPFN